MDDWRIIIAIAAILGPALLYLGTKLGTLTSRVDSAHERMDRFEKQMVGEFAAAARESHTRMDRMENQISDCAKQDPTNHQGGDPGLILCS